MNMSGEGDREGTLLGALQKLLRSEKPRILRQDCQVLANKANGYGIQKTFILRREPFSIKVFLQLSYQIPSLCHTS